MKKVNRFLNTIKPLWFVLFTLILVLASCAPKATTPVTTTVTATQTKTVPTTIPIPTTITNAITITATVTATAFVTATSVTTTTVTTTKVVIPAEGVIFISNITPSSPATLHFNDWVKITFDYVIINPDGAYIWAIPQTNGKFTPNISYEGSSFPPGRGTISRSFTVVSGAVKVDEIYLLMQNTAKTKTLFEAHIPVEYTYGP